MFNRQIGCFSLSECQFDSETWEVKRKFWKIPTWQIKFLIKNKLNQIDWDERQFLSKLQNL